MLSERARGKENGRQRAGGHKARATLWAVEQKPR